jgi:hypothetical protein
MPAISGATPPTTNCRPGDTGGHCVPFDPSIPFESGAWAGPIPAVVPPPKESIVPSCAQWCIWNWDAMAPWNVTSEALCIGRCLMENYVPAKTAAQWGFLPPPAGGANQCLTQKDSKTCNALSNCAWGKEPYKDPVTGQTGPPRQGAVSYCMDKTCDYKDGLSDKASCDTAGCTWLPPETGPSPLPGYCAPVAPAQPM